jgi:anti-sigma factor RsiW
MIGGLRLDELCSRYLDGDLPPEERLRFERLLGEDEEARRRLEALRAVVRGLDALPKESPPPALKAEVRRRVAALSASRRWLDRVQDRLPRVVLDSPLLASFAVVLALGASLYLLAHGAARWAERPSTLVVAPGSTVTAPDGAAVRVVGERRFEWREGMWWEEGVLEHPVQLLRDTELADWLDLHPADRELSPLGAVVVEGEGDAVVLSFAEPERLP